MPRDLQAALAAAPDKIQEVWKDITPTARWEWVRWVNATRNPGTRQRRVDVIGEALKSAVRLTFPKGALLRDPKHVFNTRLDSATVRAVDFREGDMVGEAALRALIRQAVKLNMSKARTR